MAYLSVRFRKSAVFSSVSRGLHRRFFPLNSFFSSSSSSFFSSHRFFSSSSEEYTHIIVGGGSAGCVLANRLSADPSTRVLLLEAGKTGTSLLDFWKIYMPAALTYNLMNNKYNWYYHTEPQKHMNNRRLYHPRGKVLGGGSSLNAMVYIRGHAYDYDRWSHEEGCEGWSYAECLPYFRKSETYEGGANEYRGDTGPLYVTIGKCENALYEAFMRAGVEFGSSLTEDVNGYKQEGFGKFQMTIKHGIRCNTYLAYLRPAAKHRHNIEVLTGKLLSRILIEGSRAVGVEVVDVKDGEDGRGGGGGGKVGGVGGVERSVIHLAPGGVLCLCGGAFNTPQMLQLSGIGDAKLLKSLGIDVLQHMPGVGQNLQDHLECYAQWHCRKNISLLESQRWWNMLWIGMEWFALQTGLGASSHLECGAFTKTKPEVKHPDIQWHFLPGLIENHGRSPASFHAYQVHIGTMRPKSRGYVHIQSKSPYVHPIIQPNYFQDKQDIDDLAICIEQARAVMNQPAFDEFKGAEIKPGPNIKSRADVEEFLRRNCETAYHPSCTCKMGPQNDPLAVVDPATLNVWGFDNLKVVDASIMPSIVSGNLNAPVIMMAEKASDMILGVPPLAPIKNALVYESDGGGGYEKQNKNKNDESDKQNDEVKVNSTGENAGESNASFLNRLAG